MLSWAIIWLKSNDEKYLPAILGKQRAWQEIQNLYVYEVCDSKSEKPPPRYVLFQAGDPLRYSAYAWIMWDWPTWLNKPCWILTK